MFFEYNSFYHNSFETLERTNLNSFILAPQYPTNITLSSVQQIHNQLPRIQIDDIINKEEIKIFFDEIVCPICFDVIDDAKTCIKCEANFCGDCISKWAQTSQSRCPCCRDQGKETYLSSRDGINNRTYQNIQEYNRGKYSACPKIFKKLLNSIQVDCHYPQCKTILNLDERINHLKVCTYHPKKCLNGQCEEMVSAVTKEDHDKVCEYRRESCQYCRQSFTAKELLSHQDICLENKEKCLKCNQLYQIQQRKKHGIICPNKIVECYACFKKFLQKDFLKHSQLVCYQQLYKKSLKNNKKQQKLMQLQSNLINNFIQDLKTKLEYPEINIDKSQILKCIDDFSQKNKQNEFHQKDENQNYFQESDFTIYKKNKRKRNENQFEVQSNSSISQDDSQRKHIDNSSSSNSCSAKQNNCSQLQQSSDEEEEKENMYQDFNYIELKINQPSSLNTLFNSSQIQSCNQKEEQEYNIANTILSEYDQQLQHKVLDEKVQINRQNLQIINLNQQIILPQIPMNQNQTDFLDSFYEMQDENEILQILAYQN